MAENTGNVGLAELADVMEASSSTYGLIARMYLEEPSAEFIDALRQTRFPAATGNEFVDKGYRLIATYLSRVGAAAQDELAADYCRTFIGNAYFKVSDPNLIGKMSGHVDGSRAFKRYRKIEDETLKSVIDQIG